MLSIKSIFHVDSIIIMIMELLVRVEPCIYIYFSIKCHLIPQILPNCNNISQYIQTPYTFFLTTSLQESSIILLHLDRFLPGLAEHLLPWNFLPCHLGCFFLLLPVLGVPVSWLPCLPFFGLPPCFGTAHLPVAS